MRFWVFFSWGRREAGLIACSHSRPIKPYFVEILYRVRWENCFSIKIKGHAVVGLTHNMGKVKTKWKRIKIHFYSFKVFHHSLIVYHAKGHSFALPQWNSNLHKDISVNRCSHEHVYNDLWCCFKWTCLPFINEVFVCTEIYVCMYSPISVYQPIEGVTHSSHRLIEIFECVCNGRKDKVTIKLNK